jgi:phosphatidylserine/phosphatidylglycerophosphate/cardiolipin synthase-like enzyme
MLWIEIATGFTGALTLMFAVRAVLRRLGMMPSVEVRLGPKGGCQEAVLRELGRAQREVLILARRLTAEPLAPALIEAKKRGAHIDIVLDPCNERERPAELKVFIDQGLAPSIDASHPATLAQVIVIDQQTVITGSYDFSRKGDEECAADVVILKGHPEAARAYRQSFLGHKAHARAAQVKPAEPAKKAA